MKRSQIMIELIKDEINVVQAMDILNLLLQDIKDKKIKKWLDNEINVVDNKIGIMRIGDVDYISLTDLAKYQNPEDPSGVIRNWMSNRNSFDYYGLWEQINNENFNSVEFHVIKTEEADVL